MNNIFSEKISSAVSTGVRGNKNTEGRQSNNIRVISPWLVFKNNLSIWNNHMHSLDVKRIMIRMGLSHVHYVDA